MQFDFNETDNVINGPDIGAWYQYFITTEVGIAEAFGALVWPQINRLTNVTSKTAITWDNTKSTPLQINSAWVDRDDGASIIAATSNSIQINPPAVFVKDVANISAIKAKTDLLNFTGTDVKATLDGEEVVTDTASRNASKADLGTVETELGTIDISLQQRNVPIIEQPKKSNYGQSGF
jgi:lipopolysaccharide export system protein LptA